MTCALLVPDGWSARNVLLAPLLRHVSGRGPVEVLHVLPDEVLMTYAVPPAAEIRWVRLLPATEHRFAYVVRKLLHLAHLRWANTSAMRHLSRLPGTLPRRPRATRRAALLVARGLASWRATRLLKRVHEAAARRSPTVRHYRQLFTEMRPDVVCSAHQRPLIILAPVLAARALGVPTATFILSWDNLSSKGRFAASFDHYLVWSHLMREELCHYYPDVKRSSIHVVGAPQFDFHADDSLLVSRKEFFGRLGADPARPVVCYAGSDEVIAPEEPEQLRVLLELIEAGRIDGAPQVVLRPHPADGNPGRFDAVVRSFANVIVAPPAWQLADTRTQLSPKDEGNAAYLVPLPQDAVILANLAYHSDVNVNIASTTTLDFAIHDTPVVNVGFDVATPPVLGKPLVEVYYEFEHYRPVIELGAARLAATPHELAGHVNAYLRDPGLDRVGRRRLLELELGVPVGDASRTAAEILASIAA